MSDQERYYDDPAPDFKGAKSGKSKVLYGVILSAVGAALFLNSTLAANVSLSSGAVEFGQGILATTACDSSFTVKPRSDFSNSSGNFKLSALDITSLDSTANGCAGKALTFNFYGDTSTVSLGSITIADGGSSFSSASGSISTTGYGTSATSLTLTLTSSSIISASVFKVTVESTLSTCATGGVCNIGDTGPGGGIVFYKAVTAFACGPTLSDSCLYLESAPSNWSGGSDSAISISWSGNTTQSVGTGGGDTATATAIGWGYRNTLAAIAQSNTANKVITRARAYNGGGRNDWFVPSKDELNQLYIRKATVGGFSSTSYWSSSEFSSTNVWEQDFGNGNQWNNGKSGGDTLRPIRAF
jgi:hypothetical protein